MSPKTGSRFLPALLPVLAVLAAGLAVPPAGAADAKPLAVSAVVLSKNICKFETGTAAALDFGSLDPLGASNVVRSTGFGARCLGSSNSGTFVITQNGGLHATAGQNRMRHASVATEFIRYSLAISPSSGTALKNQVFAVTVTGTVLGPSYQDARAGAYSDTVVITISP